MPSGHRWELLRRLSSWITCAGPRQAPFPRHEESPQPVPPVKPASSSQRDFARRPPELDELIVLFIDDEPFFLDVLDV